ncbi:hypothetical protein [Alteribacillus persepolensis]|nr:hypothetical protein [Alteribacillus persepolensis]
MRTEFVWKKANGRYQEKLQTKIRPPLQDIEELNEEERLYGDQDLDEMGEEATLTREYLEKNSRND